MLESNPSRNSQLETHPNDEQGRRPFGRRLDRLDRFPHASSNSSREAVAKRHPYLCRNRIKIRSRMSYERRSVALPTWSMAGFDTSRSSGNSDIDRR